MHKDLHGGLDLKPDFFLWHSTQAAEFYCVFLMSSFFIFYPILCYLKCNFLLFLLCLLHKCLKSWIVFYWKNYTSPTWRSFPLGDVYLTFTAL